MYLFRVSGTEPNGLDDEYVIMDKNQKSCIIAYQRVFPGENVYTWNSKITDDFITFKVKGFSEFYDDITVYIEIIDYRYENISKKMIDNYTMSVFKHRMKIPLSFDFSVCSIKNFDIIVSNQSKFLLPEKPKKYQPEFKIYTGGKGFETIRESSYLFNDDKDDLKMSYQMSLMSRNR
jgi:hypothetical protein